ncbi:MAG: hydroxyacid dehydrogenase, partial [Calditrichaeota bacterium]|nr:hydroxyacid dehydrogenase [Calditrichota bacterium]
MRILIASSIDPKKVEQLKQQHDVICAFNAKEDVLKSQIKDREVLIFRSGVTISAAVMESAPELKLLVRAGSGTDNIDLDYVEKRGLTLIRVPQPGAKAVAEMAFGMMIGLARNIVHADSLLRRG